MHVALVQQIAERTFLFCIFLVFIIYLLFFLIIVAFEVLLDYSVAKLALASLHSGSVFLFTRNNQIFGVKEGCRCANWIPYVYTQSTKKITGSLCIYVPLVTPSVAVQELISQ